MSKNYFVHSTAILSPKAKVGAGTKIWHFSHIREGAFIGKNCNLGQNVYIDTGVKIGNNVKIQNGVSIYKGIIIEDDVLVGPHSTFTNDLFPRSFSAKWKVVPTFLKKGCSVGSNATIVCGTTLGEYCMVGAGAVVIDDILPHTLVVGNPARAKGFVCRCGQPFKTLTNRKQLNHLKCSACKKTLRIKISS